MTQRIAEADGGRVWMECKRRYTIWKDGKRRKLSAGYVAWTGKWEVTVGTGYYYTCDTEADAVCLLWSKA
jgi:hypothetical protein